MMSNAMTITREQLEKAAKAAGLADAEVERGGNHIVTAMLPGLRCYFDPLHDRGQLLDLAMACRIAIEPRADFIIYDIGSKSKVVDVNCQDFPALAEAVILAACEQFDAKGIGHAMTLHGEKIPAGTKLYPHPAPSIPEGELTLPEQLRNRPNPEWYRKKIAESGDGEPHCIGSAAPKVLSSPDQNCITQKVPDVWQLIEECRSSVKFDLNRYERMALDFKRLGAEGKRTYEMADAEATRLHALLEKIDATLHKD